MKQLIVFSGPPASGKSLIGGMLARRLGIAHFEMDRIRVALMPDSAHTRQDRIVAYRAMHAAAIAVLDSGSSVIVNAGYSHTGERKEIRRIASGHDAQLVLIECAVPVEIAVERCRDRAATHPGLDLTGERVRELVDGFPYTHAGLLLDSTLPADRLLDLVEDYLESGANLPSRYR